MLAVWFTGIIWQVFFNVLFVVILKPSLEEVFFTVIPVLVDAQKTMSKTLLIQNAIILQRVENGREEKYIHGSCGKI
jgi:hypothetical protein